MAREEVTVINLTDDRDGGPADASRVFNCEGVEYVIDLNATNLALLDDALAIVAEWAKFARRVESTAKAKPGRKATKTAAAKTARVRTTPDPARQEYLTTVRNWAMANDLEIGRTGRIARKVIDAYEAAQKPSGNGAGRRRAKATAAAA